MAAEMKKTRIRDGVGGRMRGSLAYPRGVDGGSPHREGRRTPALYTAAFSNAGLFTRYFQKAGRSGMHSTTPATHITPPETIEDRIEEIEATHPARAFPSNGPLA